MACGGTATSCTISGISLMQALTPESLPGRLNASPEPELHAAVGSSPAAPIADA